MIQILKNRMLIRKGMALATELDAQGMQTAEGPEVETCGLPPLDLLDEAQIPALFDESEDRAVAGRIAEQFIRRGVDVSYVGPVHATRMTTYQYRLSDDDFGLITKVDDTLRQMISMAVKTSGVSFQAPIPNSATIAVHVPCKESCARVRLAPFVTQARENALRVPLVIGEDYRGRPRVLDLATECHQLVAGQTGSGKSVFLRSLVLGIAMSCQPQDVRLILVDGKGLDLPVFNRLPHNACPVITDSRQVMGALRWMNEELDRRRQIIGSGRITDIWAYAATHKEAELANQESLPAIVFIVDEFQTVVSGNGNAEAEKLLQRLTQQGRACGIFVILATQRPSVDILQGSTKTNIPGRVCFRLPTQVDSRVVLDQGGAELLAQPGDLLAVESSVGSMGRYQAPFATDEEVERVCRFFESKPPKDTQHLCEVTKPIARIAVSSTLPAGNQSGGTKSAPVSKEDLVKPTGFAPVRVSRDAILRKLSWAYPDRNWKVELIYLPFLLGIVGNKHNHQVLYCPQSKEIITRIVPWTAVAVGPLLDGSGRQLEILAAIRRLPRHTVTQTEIRTWLAKQDLPDANLVDLMSAGYLKPNFQVVRALQQSPVLAKNLNLSIVPDSQICVLLISTTACNLGKLQLRKTLGSLWTLPVERISLIGLPAYLATADKEDSLYLSASHPIPWRNRLEDLSMGDAVSMWEALNNVPELESFGHMV